MTFDEFKVFVKKLNNDDLSTLDFIIDKEIRKRLRGS